MKNLILILFALLVFASCKKDGLPVDNGCISQIERQHFGVSVSDSVAAVQLLKQNNLPTNDLVFESIQLYDTLTISGSTNVYQYIFAVQYLNTLPVLSYDFGYTFKEGILQQVTGARYNGITLNTHSTQSPPRLREFYMSEVNKNASLTLAAALKDSCLVAEFGYYDLNVDFSVLVNDHTPNFIKAWRVAPAHSSYPQAIFRDDNGQLISYSGGLIEF
jgi:hypothetical protein